MTPVTVKVISQAPGLPEYATAGAAGMDVRAYLPSPVTLAPGARTLIPTGLRVEIPAGYELQLRPRSGLALRNGITLLNSPGTVDSDYRGEIGVIMINLGSEPFIINNGDRIAQAVLARCERIRWQPCAELDTTGRGDGGFGHTGV